MEIQTRFSGNAKKPYSGICSHSCWYAHEDKCVCRCGGVYHGLGLKEHEKELDPSVFALTVNQAKEFTDKIKEPKCRWCGEDISSEPVLAYEHSAGWIVRGFEKKLWLYIECPKCSYQWALWKLGVVRE